MDSLNNKALIICFLTTIIAENGIALESVQQSYADETTQIFLQDLIDFGFLEYDLTIHKYVLKQSAVELLKHGNLIHTNSSGIETAGNCGSTLGNGCDSRDK